MMKPIAGENKKKKTWRFWSSFLLWVLISSLLILFNSYLMAVVSSSAILKSLEVFGGAGTLVVFVFVCGAIFLLPPLLSWRKSKKGRAVFWCLAWNLGLLVVTLCFGPVSSWMKSQGATPVALALGTDSWMVQELFGKRLGWSSSQVVPIFGKIDGSEPFVERWSEIVEALKEAESVTQLSPVVQQSNLATVQTWSEKNQLLALKHVRDQIELLEFDAKKEKRKWQLYDFEKNPSTVRLQWRAYGKESRDDFLSNEVRLVNEDGQWKADFSIELKSFKEIIQRRENSSHR